MGSLPLGQDKAKRMVIKGGARAVADDAGWRLARCRESQAGNYQFRRAVLIL